MTVAAGLNGAQPTQNRSKAVRRGDEALLVALAGGFTQAEAAKRAGLSESTVRRRIAEPGFRARLLAARATLFEEGLALLARGYPAAAGVLLSLLQPGNSPAVRRGAAVSILDLGAKLRQVTDQEERLTAIEQRLPPNGHARHSGWR